MTLVPVTLAHVLVLSAAVFAIGLYAVLAKRHVVAVLMGVELMVNAVNIALVGAARFLPAGGPAPGPLAGQVLALFVITVAAAEAAVALALLLAVYRQRRTVNLDDISLLRG